MKFCPVCKNYLYLKTASQDPGATPQLTRTCVNCNYSEVDAKGGLIMETVVGQRSSEAFKIAINEFTRQDNTLPHIKLLPCPKESCQTNTAGAERDVIYMTYDAPRKKNVYICNVCGEQWKSRD